MNRHSLLRIGSISVVILFALLLLGIFTPVEKNSSRQVIFRIEKGEGSKEIASNLKAQKLIFSSALFRFYVLSIGVSEKLKAGEYLLSPGLSIPQIAQKFVEGDVLVRKFTIIEGWNIRDIGKYFEKEGIAQMEELFQVVGFPATDYRKAIDLPLPRDFTKEYSILADKPTYVGLEGYLFPDTYEIKRGESVVEIVRKLLENSEKKFDQELRSKTLSQGKTIFEIITMASLLEKEVQTLEDKKIVAGILWKRLSAGMPLQVDATISYITGKNTIRISRDDMNIDSPYNTYRYPGLPVGPISNPGLESIQAALSPQESEFWYYLSAPDGKTIFSKTLQEHNTAKAKYLN